MTTDAAGPRAAGTPWRLLAGAVPAILSSSLVIGTAAWLGRVSGARGTGAALALWLDTWAAYAVWAAIVTVPAVVLLGWPLDRLTAGLGPLAAAVRFAALGFAVGAVAGYAILASIDAGLVGAAVVAPIGALAAFTSRLLVEPLARRRVLLAVLAAVCVGLVAAGG